MIILSALGQEDDRVAGLRLGADDYVVKPFSVKELLARVESVLRRSPERPHDVSEIVFDQGQADLGRAEVRFADGGRAELSEKEVELLRYLAANRGRVILRDELLLRVWQISPRGLPTRTIDMHVTRLREKLSRRSEPATVDSDRPRQGIYVCPGARRGMRRPWQIWSVFGGCLLLIVAAVGWLSFRALESERAEQAARGRAALEENARLALWRLDSAVAPLIAQENANLYSIFQPRETKPRGKAAAGKSSIIPSPLLGASNPQIRLHFEIDPTGEIRSPEVLVPEQAARVAPGSAGDARLQQSRERLQQLQRLIDRPRLLGGLARASPPLVDQSTDAQRWNVINPLAANSNTASSNPTSDRARRPTRH